MQSADSVVAAYGALPDHQPIVQGSRVLLSDAPFIQRGTSYLDPGREYVNHTIEHRRSGQICLLLL